MPAALAVAVSGSQLATRTPKAPASAMRRIKTTTETSVNGTMQIPKTPRSAAITVWVPWTSAALAAVA